MGKEVKCLIDELRVETIPTFQICSYRKKKQSSDAEFIEEGLAPSPHNSLRRRSLDG